MKKLILIICAIITSCATQSSAISEARKFQKELNAEYKKLKTTPLRGDNFTGFTRPVNHHLAAVSNRIAVTIVSDHADFSF